MTIVSIQPDSSTSSDTTINAGSQTTNYDTDPTVSTGGPASTKKALLKFDLSSIPTDATINSATLRMAVNSQVGATVTVHRSLTSWVASQATWQIRATATAWVGGFGGGSGSDYAASSSDSNVINATGDWDFDVTSDVANIVNSAGNNYGWWLLQASGLATVYYASNWGTAGDRPELIVDYTPASIPTDIFGTSTGSSVASGTLFAIGSLVGSISGQATVSAILITNEYMRGTAIGQAIVTAIHSSKAYLSGSVLGSSSASGNIQGEILLAPGSAVGSSSVSGDIKGVYYLTGESLGSSLVSASGSFEGQLRGLAEGSAFASATGYAKAIGVVVLQNCYLLPVFYVTDGSYKDNGQQNILDFLSYRSGYRLNNWDPTIIQFKDGGRWANSPNAQGRRLKGYVFDNAIEVLDLNLVGADQDRAIQFLHDLWNFQQATADYWSSAWASLPIYLVSRTAKETNTRYAIIHMISCPQLKNIYAQPFFDDQQAAVDTLTLRIERGHWLSSPPGEFECVPISSIRSWTVAGWQSGS